MQDLQLILQLLQPSLLPTPESAIICAVSCTWHSISGTLLAGAFTLKDKIKGKSTDTENEDVQQAE